MTASNTFSRRIAAAATAMMLSLVMFSNTLTVPVQASPEVFASAYVGAVA